eukprot:1154939-Pelagomonas_calceolata.AAC.12
MGRRYDEEEYITVLAACALAHDLELLSAGDSTEIGDSIEIGVCAGCTCMYLPVYLHFIMRCASISGTAPSRGQH